MFGHSLPRLSVTPDILLYTGVSEKSWNGVPITPGGYACVSPVSGRSARTKKETCVYVPPENSVIQDSGAFSDSWDQRLSFGAALERQIAHARKFGYHQQISHRATYDLLIDEVWSDGNRHKRRWSVAAAEAALNETIAAAAWLNQHRNGQALILSAQGVDAAQYLRCVQRLFPLFRDGDVLGLGGWCIIGKMPRQMMPVFEETVRAIIPFVAREGIQRVHVWGVIYPPALAALFAAASEHGIAVSTDSAGVSLNPVYGEWGYGLWRDNAYVRPPAESIGADRAKHAALTRAWLNQFAQSADYAVTLRRSGKCDARLRSVTRPCLICGAEMEGRRAHIKTCSAKCRKALERQTTTQNS